MNTPPPLQITGQSPLQQRMKLPLSSQEMNPLQHRIMLSCWRAFRGHASMELETNDGFFINLHTFTGLRVKETKYIPSIFVTNMITNEETIIISCYVGTYSYIRLLRKITILISTSKR